VFVVGPTGALGQMQVSEALRQAEDLGLDLIEVNTKATPAVCRIADYGKMKYDAEKKAKEARQNQTVVTVKELKFRPKIGDHDLEVKVNHAKEFLSRGDKVKLLIQFRGREIVHPEVGREVLRRVLAALQDVASIEQQMTSEGKTAFVVVGPKKK
jgi:translation initiation factor IF-3